MDRSIQFLFGQFVPQCRHWIYKSFDYHVLQFMDGGEVTLWLDEERFDLRGRWFWSSYPGPVIAFRPADLESSWVHRYLAFGGEVLEEWKAEGLFPIRPQAAPEGDWGRRFDEMLELSRRTDRWGSLRAAILLEGILVELAEARERPDVAVPSWLAETLSRMSVMGASASQAELAAEAGMSLRTFRRKFLAAMGMSPGEYAIGRRIGHAKEMLGATSIPIKEVARELGYRDVSFFARQFRLVTGVAPGAYRRSREG